MKVGIIHRYEAPKDPDIEVYKEILSFNKIEYKVLNVSSPDFWKDIEDVDRVIFKWANTSSDYKLAHTILPIIETHYNTKCFPSQATSWHYDDKVREYYLLKRYGYPMAESYIFWNKKDAKEFVKTANLPLVHKLTGGSGSTAVSIVKSRRKAMRFVKRAFGRGTNQNPGFFQTLRVYNYNLRRIYRKYGIEFRNFLIGKDRTPHWMKHKNYVLFQKFYPNNTYDTRVQITGNRGYAFIRHNRENDFRASGSNNWSLDKSKINMDMVKMAFEISQKMDFQSMAYDFIYDENNKPVIVEISYCYGDYPEFSTGYWDPELNWHDGSYLPQYLELVDLLEMPDLLQPELETESEYKKAKIN
jgi:glutathione synthase/RimK-type ligase-like ATP-grasp enzyme